MKIIIESDNGFSYEWIEGTKTINLLDNFHEHKHAFSINFSRKRNHRYQNKPSLTNAIKTIENYEKDQ